MQLASPPSKPKPPRAEMRSSRGGMVAAAAVAAILAALTIGLAVRQLRDGAREGATPTAVLVAGDTIAKGTSGRAAVDLGALRPASVAKEDVQPGALTDARALEGKVAVRDIVPGQQLTKDDFTAARSSLPAKLGADQRALSIPVTTSSGLIGDVKPGDKVDVLGGFQTETASGRMRPVLRLLAEDVLVLTAPDSGPNAAKAATSGSTEQQVTIRVGRNDAERLAFAADNGKLWLALRPPTGTRVQRPKLMTLERVLAGSRPLPTEGSR